MGRELILLAQKAEYKPNNGENSEQVGNLVIPVVPTYRLFIKIILTTTFLKYGFLSLI